MTADAPWITRRLHDRWNLRPDQRLATAVLGTGTLTTLEPVGLRSVDREVRLWRVTAETEKEEDPIIPVTPRTRTFDAIQVQVPSASDSVNSASTLERVHDGRGDGFHGRSPNTAPSPPCKAEPRLRQQSRPVPTDPSWLVRGPLSSGFRPRSLTGHQRSRGLGSDGRVTPRLAFYTSPLSLPPVGRS